MIVDVVGLSNAINSEDRESGRMFVRTKTGEEYHGYVTNGESPHSVPIGIVDGNKTTLVMIPFWNVERTEFYFEHE